MGKRFSHGTAVASVIAGARPSNFADRAHGVAWGARLAVFAIPLGTASDAPYNPASLTGLASNDTGDAAVYQYVLGWRTTDGEPIDFLNLSFGYSGLIDDYTETELTTNYGTTIDALKQSDRAGSNLDKTILVWAAGNAHGRDCTSGSYCVNGKVVASSPEILPGLVARIDGPPGPQHRRRRPRSGRPDRRLLQSLRDRCELVHHHPRRGRPDRLFRAAPRRPGKAGRRQEGSPRGRPPARGTSYAAPMVTGGLAVMKHLFRDQLFNTALVERLFTTADRQRALRRQQHLRPGGDGPRRRDGARRHDPGRPRRPGRRHRPPLAGDPP